MSELSSERARGYRHPDREDLSTKAKRKEKHKVPGTGKCLGVSEKLQLMKERGQGQVLKSHTHPPKKPGPHFKTKGVTLKVYKQRLFSKYLVSRSMENECTGMGHKYGGPLRSQLSTIQMGHRKM